jgi:hypothetical protein
MGQSAYITSTDFKTQLTHHQLDMGYLCQAKHSLVCVDLLQSVGFWRFLDWYVSHPASQHELDDHGTGWTTAFISNPYNFDTYGPTILEWLTFWVASAMEIEGSVMIPQVCNEAAYVALEVSCTVYDIMGQNSVATAAALSVL